MEVAPRYTVLTLFILFKLLYAAYTVACMPIYILLMKSDVMLVKRGAPIDFGKKKWYDVSNAGPQLTF